MKDNLEIFLFFTSSASEVPQSKLNTVIEKSYRIALKYLHYNRVRISKHISKEGITLQELAIDCIADLFVKENNDELISIRRTFQNWSPSITSEEDCLYFINQIIANRVEQHIFKLLKEEDPFFSKLLDSVNYLVRNSGFCKIHFLGKSFITENNIENFVGCFISTDEFEKLPLALFQNKKMLLIDLFNYLKNQTDYNVAIPLNDLIKRLKHLNFSDYVVNEYSSNEFRKIEINEIVAQGFRLAMEKLSHSYVERGKLDELESKAFESALRAMAHDLCDGGINPGLYKYLSIYFNDLSETDYQTKYHNILEYLLKVMKNNIAEKLTEKD